MLETITQADWAILHAIHHLQCGTLDFLMPKITALGNLGMIWVLVGVCMIVSRRYRKWGILLLASLLTGVVLGSGILKPLVARARPCWLEPVVLLVGTPQDYSFPSGHTIASVLSAVIIGRANRKWAPFAVMTALLIAFSRRYLYVHFPSDVLAGALIGLVIGMAGSRIAEKWEQKTE